MVSGDIAPSYFLECLLYNVPNANFGPTFRDTYYKVVNCLNGYDITNLSCQDEQLQLFGDEPEQWSVRKANQFIAALAQLWNNA